MKKAIIYKRTVQAVNVPGLVFVVAWFAFYSTVWRLCISVPVLGWFLEMVAADQVPDKVYFQFLLSERLPLLSGLFWCIVFVLCSCYFITVPFGALYQ